MLLTFFTKKPQDPQVNLIDYALNSRTKFLFRSLAHGFVSLIKSNQFNNLEIFKELLTQHAKYYPRQLPMHIQNLSAKDQFEYLLVYTQPHIETLIPSLAYTLQQYAIDTICLYPEQYGNLLLEGNSIEHLRKTSNLDHPSILQAIADNVLKINIYLERYPEAYLLPVKEYYLSEIKSSLNLYIHYQDHLYMCQSEIEGEQ